MKRAAFISMAGLKPSVSKKLQAEGVQIISCVDNDDSGRQFGLCPFWKCEETSWLSGI